MYKEISKLIMYGNLDNNSILSSMADIFNRFDNNLSSKEELITDIYTQIKRILEVATDYGFDNNLWHNYLTYFLITNENPFSIHAKRLVLMTEVSTYLPEMILRCFTIFSIMISVK